VAGDRRARVVVDSVITILGTVGLLLVVVSVAGMLLSRESRKLWLLVTIAGTVMIGLDVVSIAVLAEHVGD
jgi:hypothetical protein